METTKREALVSIAIACLMFTLGLLIQQGIRTAVTNRNKEYETALRITDSSTFEYAMRTNAGNAFVYGVLEAETPVTNPEIEGEWLSIEKVKERYTRHQRTVTKEVNGKTVTETEYYWTWDRVGSETWHSDNIIFLGATFPYGLITNVYGRHFRTDTSGHIRYKWYVKAVEHSGTIYTKLEDSTIAQTMFYEDKFIDDVFNLLHQGEAGALIGFWTLWIILTAGLIIGFCSLQNKWLE